MGIRARILAYEECRLGGGSDFYVILEKHFTNDEGEVYIETHAWRELLKEHPEIREKFHDETDEVQQDLDEHGGCVSYAFF